MCLVHLGGLATKGDDFLDSDTRGVRMESRCRSFMLSNDRCRIVE